MTKKNIQPMSEEEIQKEIEDLVARDEPSEGIEGLEQTQPLDPDVDEEDI